MQATLENLISFIIYQKPNRAQLLKYLNAVLATDKTEKSKRFISTASKKIKEETIANGQLTELPTNIRGMVTSEPAETFPENRFLETEAVRRTASEIIRILEVQKNLKRSTSTIRLPCFSTEQAAVARRCSQDTLQSRFISPTTISASAVLLIL